MYEGNNDEVEKVDYIDRNVTLSPCYFQTLCRGHPTEFASYFHYCRSLRFDDKPDYAYLKRLFRNLFIREGLIHFLSPAIKLIISFC